VSIRDNNINIVSYSERGDKNQLEVAKGLVKSLMLKQKKEENNV
jgi:hypothetical protein